MISHDPNQTIDCRRTNGLRSTRRQILAAIPAFALVRSLLADNDRKHARIGLCTFSCHQHWKAVQENRATVQFRDALGFFRYARKIGTMGVQTSLRSSDPSVAIQMSKLVTDEGGYYEGELRFPKSNQDLDSFESEVRLLRTAGATVARAVFPGGRRYEVFHTLGEFQTFHRNAEKLLEMVEPVLSRHQLKLAVENHKDLTSIELAQMMKKIGSQWVGVLVDTGNSIALLEQPLETMQILAPYVLSVHLKDMAVQAVDDGFLLSEVPLGTGVLDLPKIIQMLQNSNENVVLNLEMATRDPLRIPCLNDTYFASFPERKATHLNEMMHWVQNNPLQEKTPSITGKTVEEIINDEHRNNRLCVDWMRDHIV